MNDQSQKQTAPLGDSHNWTNLNNETAIVPEGGKLLRRMLQEAAEGNDEYIVTNIRSIRLEVRGIFEDVHLENGRAVLGRTDHRQASHPQVDLTHFGAAERGVSRQHARLELHNNHLMIVDLNSSNGTYLRGRRIEPGTPARVYPEDEVLLGRLSVKILFE